MQTAHEGSVTIVRSQRVHDLPSGIAEYKGRSRNAKTRCETDTGSPTQHLALTETDEALIFVRNKDRASKLQGTREKPTATSQALTEGKSLFFV
jgi:hypothetical protein